MNIQGRESQDNRTSTLQLAKEFKKIGLLKFELLVSGIRITGQAEQFLQSAKKPIRTRSGTSGGLDLVLPYEIHVNCPVSENFTSQSPLTLDQVDEKLVISRNEEILTSVKVQPVPQYYDLTTSDGIPMAKIGQMCSGDRFCYGMTGPYCWFWKSDRRCKYCSIGLNAERDVSGKTEARLLETLGHAINDPEIPARHVLIGGGTPDGEDMGAILASKLCLAIKKNFNISCYVMICAPLKNEYINMLRDAGVDELGMNVELYSDEAWQRYIPGKYEHIGKKRYLEALEHAVKLFGPINTRSIIIAGLEDSNHTIVGAETLASVGVMPILSSFRPLTGTEMENHHGFDYMTYWNLFVEIHERIAKYGIPTGPTCICCQNNVLALPLPSGPYRYY